MANENPTLLAHLAWRFPGATEDVATEALAFILRKEERARAALHALLKEASGDDLPPIASAETQRVYRGTMRPDLVALGGDEREIALVESKFWATTTAAQPNGYLRLLEEDLKPHAKSLLFLAPLVRQDSLWKELLGKAEQEKFQVDDAGERGGVRSATVGSGGSQMMLTSWTTLLDRIARATRGGSSELGELRGLCAMIEATPPPPPEPFRALIDEAIKQAEDQRYVNTEGLTVGRWYGNYGRYFRFVSGDKRLGVARLGVDLDRLKSPLFLWFTVYTLDHIKHVRHALDGDIDEGDCVSIPPPDGGDFQVAWVVARLQEVRDRLQAPDAPPADE